MLAADVDVDAFDRKVLRDFIGPDGRLKSLPAQRKKLVVVLRHVLQYFEFDVQYPEQQVNEILAQVNEDTALLRRELVGLHWMARPRQLLAGGLTGTDKPPTPSIWTGRWTCLTGGTPGWTCRPVAGRP